MQQQDRLLHRAEAMADGTDVWERALAFMDAQVLLTAHQLGVFERLAEQPRRPDDLADALGLPHSACLRFVAMLTALGLVERRVDGRLVNAPDMEDALVSGRPGYIGALFSYVRQVLYPAWGHLDRALIENAPQCHRATDNGSNPQETMFDDDHRLRSFLAGMHALSYTSAAQFAQHVPELGIIDSLVDVGGASGGFLIALAERYARLKGTVFDLPPVVRVAREYIQAAGLSDRLDAIPGDFWRDQIPDGAGGYGLGFILHDWDDAGGDIILDRIRTAAPRGAMLIVAEHLVDPDGAGPLFAIRQDLNMLVTARGRERTEAEYANWLGRHGFAMESSYGCAFGKHYMCARRR